MAQLAHNVPGWRQEVLNRALSGNPAYEQVVVRNLGLQHDHWDQDFRKFLAHASIVARGRLYQANMIEDYEIEDVQLIALGDAFGVGLPAMTVNDARDYYKQAVIAAITCDRQMPRVPAEDPAAFGVDAAAYGPVVRAAAAGEQPVDPANINFEAGSLLPTTFDQAFQYVETNIDRIYEVYEVPQTESAVVTSLVSVCKTGTVSSKFVSKIQNSLLVEIGKDVVISANLVKRFYHTFVRAITPELARTFFNAILLRVPLSAMRVRLTIEQCAEHGITGLLMVYNALRQYPDFRWAVLNIMQPGEIERATEAITAWNGDDYAGYSRNLGVMAASRYQLAVYTAKQLHIVCGGQATLTKYKGGGNKKNPTIDGLIETYNTNRMNAIDALGEENQNAQAAINALNAAAVEAVNRLQAAVVAKEAVIANLREQQNQN